MDTLGGQGEYEDVDTVPMSIIALERCLARQDDQTVKEMLG